MNKHREQVVLQAFKKFYDEFKDCVQDVQYYCPREYALSENITCKEMCFSLDGFTVNFGDNQMKTWLCPCNQFGSKGAMERLKNLLKREGII